VGTFEPVARATGVSDATAAEALSVAAADLLAQGETVNACFKYRESVALDASPVRYLALATCWERAGRTASAWEAYRRAGELAALGQSEYGPTAHEGEARLSSQLTRLEVDTPADAAATELVVDLDGAHLAPALYGVPVPVDPGVHHLTAAAPGHQTWSLELTLPANAGTTRLGVPSMPSVARAAQVDASPLPIAAREPAPSPAGSSVDPGALRPGQTQRTVGLVLGGAGVATIGTGVVFAVMAANARAALDAKCFQSICSASGKKEYDEAKRDAVLGNVALGVGVASLASGIVVYLLAPAEKSAAATHLVPLVSERSFGLAASGRF
jgi:serine/threonine-protein kinase